MREFSCPLPRKRARRDYEGLDEEAAQALLDLAHYGERHREHLTRYAKSHANHFWVRASRWMCDRPS